MDVGNSTTEVAIAAIDSPGAKPRFLSASRVPTTGIKGTLPNIPGMLRSLHEAVEAAGISINAIERVLLNEATPVIGDIAMETITETIITESTMIGHNPGSPGGQGIGVGQTTHIKDLASKRKGDAVILVIPNGYDFEQTAALINQALAAGVDVQGGIAQSDDGVLIANRLSKTLPFVDEVGLIDQVPLDMLAAVEVAVSGQVIRQLSNPYGIATVFSLTSIRPTGGELVNHNEIDAALVLTRHGYSSTILPSAGSANPGSGDNYGEYGRFKDLIGKYSGRYENSVRNSIANRNGDDSGSTFASYDGTQDGIDGSGWPKPPAPVVVAPQPGPATALTLPAIRLPGSLHLPKHTISGH